MAQHQTTSWRSAAAQLLHRHRRSSQHIDALLEHEHAAGSSDARYRVPMERLVRRALQWRGALTQLLKVYSSVPAAKLQEHVRIALDLAMVELLFTDHRPAAIIDEAVKLVGGDRKRCAYVNGVLRAIARAAKRVDVPRVDATDPATLPRDVLIGPDTAWRFDRPLFADPAKKPATYVAAAQSLPKWLVSKWIAQWGFARAWSMARASNAVPGLCARVNTRRIAPHELRAALEALESRLAPPMPGLAEALVFEERPAIVSSEPFMQGQFYLQDLSGIRVGAAAAAGLRPGARVLDACAAPGGKLTHIVERLGGEGTFVALDASTSRLTRLRENLVRLGHDDVVDVVTDEDGRGLSLSRYAAQSPSAEPFDLVLLDAPCSNTGVLARRADARWRIEPDDAGALARTQLGMLASAALRVAQGGRLVYSTCTLEPEENDGVVAGFLRAHPRWRLVAWARMWPTAGEHDGGYWAVLRAPGPNHATG